MTSLLKHTENTFHIHLLNDYAVPIVEIQFPDYYIVTLEEAKKITASIGKLSKGEKMRQLYVPGTFNDIDHEVLDYSASEEGQKYSYAEAYVVPNLALRILGNFYLKVKKPINPAGLFRTRTEAIEWLLSI